MAQLKSQQDIQLKHYLMAVAAQPAVAPQERQAWARSWAAGDLNAKRDLVESFLGVVVAEAAARRGLGSSFESLLAAGNRALSGALAWICADPQNMESRARQAVLIGLRAEWMKKAGTIRD